MVTQLFFHNIDSSVSGTLPATAQSTLTSNNNIDAVTTNKTMNITIGTSQTSVAKAMASSAAPYQVFITRFVSSPLVTTSISANTWTLSCAAQTSSSTPKWPFDPATSKIPAALYIWRPSTGAKIATIFDGYSSNTTSTTGSTLEKSRLVTYTGGAVTAVANDVLIFEQWGATGNNSGTSFTFTYYYDGNATSTGDFLTVSNIASNIQTPQAITFGTGSITASTSPITIRNKYITKH